MDVLLVLERVHGSGFKSSEFGKALRRKNTIDSEIAANRFFRAVVEPV